jgi:hypothetical protein
MEWIIAAFAVVVFWFIMSYRSDKRKMIKECEIIAREVETIILIYKDNTDDQRPVSDINYLIGFISGFVQCRFSLIGINAATVKAHDLVPLVLENSQAGKFHGGESSSASLYFRMGQLALSNDPQFLLASGHGVWNAGLRLNKLNAEMMEHHITVSAFEMAARRGIDVSTSTVSVVHLELLFNSYAPKSRQYINERMKQRDEEGYIFPFGE